MTHSDSEEETVDTRIIPFLKGQKILITGATGFLAKLLVEKVGITSIFTVIITVSIQNYFIDGSISMYESVYLYN